MATVGIAQRRRPDKPCHGARTSPAPSLYQRQLCPASHSSHRSHGSSKASACRAPPTPAPRVWFPNRAMAALGRSGAVSPSRLARRLLSGGMPGASGTAVTTTSSLFIPTRTLPHQDTVHSYKLMLQAGLIRPSSSGVYHLLPLGLRALEKLTALIDREMKAIGAAKMALPILTPAALWEATGRWEAMGSELFRLKDHNSEYLLGPTHEESITDLVRQEVTSHKQLPLRLYQLDRKFRNERRVRAGLLRAREFWMKDLYTFDVSEESAAATYSEVCSAYERLFARLRLPVVKVKASTSNIGGSLSHEYHILASVGRDTILTCTRCGAGYNTELLEESGSTPDCPSNGKDCQLQESRGIEVAHSFFLGTKYSSILGATFFEAHSQQEKFMEMGCYGIGVSRLLQAAIEHGCEDGKDELFWPAAIAPYHVCISPLTTSTDPTDPIYSRALELYSALEEGECEGEGVRGGVCRGDVVLEDRAHLSIGYRLRDLRTLGFPVSIIIGQKTPVGQYEVEVLSENNDREKLIMDKRTLIQYLKNSSIP